MKMVKTYRSIALSFLFIVFGLGALFIRYFIFPFQKSKIKNYETLHSSWKFFVYLLKSTGLISIDIKDKEKIESIKNSIIVSTHPSFVDIVILMSLIPHSTCFVAEKLANNPFLNGMVFMLFILEGQEQEKWVAQAKEALEQGLNVIIFPMGTRHRKNEYPRIRRGAALIAKESGRNIEVLKIEQSFDFLHIHQPFYDAGEKRVEYNLEYIGEINTREFLDKYDDEVTFKTEVTKEISRKLYDR